MPTSGNTVFAQTAEQIITRAFRLINVMAAAQTVPAADMTTGIQTLNAMFTDWNNKGLTPWKNTPATMTPVQGQVEYNIIQRPIEIIECRWTKGDSYELLMFEIEADQYFELQNKTIEGTPTQFYYRRNRTDGTLYVWPAPHAITTELFKLTYNRPIEIVTVETEEVDVPQEWFETVTYNLAARLGDEYGAKGDIFNRVLARSEQLYEEAKMFEREGSVFFYPDAEL